jgi:cell division protein FtsA
LEKQLIAGIVVTGGGAQLRNITQYFEFITGMDTRVGYPTEHLSNSGEDITSPMYATGIGLILKGFERIKNKIKEENGSEKLTAEEKEGIHRVSGTTKFLSWIKQTSDSFFGDLTD